MTQPKPTSAVLLSLVRDARLLAAPGARKSQRALAGVLAIALLAPSASAGPLEPAPRMAPNEIQGGMATVRVESNRPGVEVEVKVGQESVHTYRRGWGMRDVWAPVCSTPCTTTALPIGTTWVGVGDASSSQFRKIETPVNITGSGTLRATWNSHAALFGSGLALSVLAAPVGISLVSFGAMENMKAKSQAFGPGSSGKQAGTPGKTMMIAGAVGGIAGLALGIGLLAAGGDSVNVAFVPGAPAPVEGPLSQADQPVPPSAFDARGGSVVVTF